MHLHFERIEKPSSYSDCDIRSLSWMGKVPDGLLQNQDDEGWKLNRTNYYQDGWLASGNIRGIVGVTYTTCRCRKTAMSELPVRTNYNLRGHRSEVTLVRWNEPYQKLATCDTSGIIFVWIKYEGRWSIELINDRSTQVTDFAWSHDGRMALICYTDGFVLVGSVTGQRYWSSMLNLDACTTTCGVWTPDDQQVLFGTSNGHIIVIHVNGTMVTQVPVRDGVKINALVWSCEKFKMEDTEDAGNPNASSGVNGPRGSARSGHRRSATTGANNSGSADQGTSDSQQGPNDASSNSPGTTRPEFCLAVSFADGHLYLMRSYDDLFPVIIRTGLEGLMCEWTNCGDLLVVAGHKSVTAESIKRQPAPGSTMCYVNHLRFYNVLGGLRYSIQLNYAMHPITAITWGHNDKRCFVATGPVLHTAWVTKRVPSLQLLSRLSIFRSLPSESAVDKLVLPSRLQSVVSSLFGKTLRCYLPDIQNLRDFVSQPPSGNIRLHCTMIRHDDDLVGGSATYVLYLEYLGGLVPILKGKRASKLKPEFIIFDPHPKPPGDAQGAPNKVEPPPSTSSKRRGSNFSNASSGPSLYWTSSGSSNPNSSDSEFDDGISLPSPLMRRRCRRKRNKRGAATEDDPLAAANGQANGGQRETGANAANQANGRNGENGFVKPESTYADEMPELEKLVLINSNIWGTKFKILGLCNWLPSCLGSVTYRTSLLHLQPRQMTLQIKELGGRRKTSMADIGADGKVNSNFASSEDEEEGPPIDEEYSAPIAPMTPKKNIRGQSCSISPERKPSLYLRSSAQQPVTNFSDFSSFMNSQLNDDLLTLQISGDGSSGPREVTVEMTSGHAPYQQQVVYQANLMQQTSTGPSLNSISTQTSFQSVTELLNCLASGGDRVGPPQPQPHPAPQVLSPAFGDLSTEDIFTAMARKFQSELPCTSRTPAAHPLNFTKFDILQANLAAHACSSPLSSPPPVVYHPPPLSQVTISPTKSVRSRSKKESPRKHQTIVDSTSSVTSDSSSFRSSHNHHRRGHFDFGSSPTTTTACDLNSRAVAGSCLVETRPVMYSTTTHDIKYIDDDDVMDGSSSSMAPPLTRSPSLFVYKSVVNNLGHPCVASSEFTNIRSSATTEYQRRLTLKVSRRSHSLDSDPPSSSTSTDNSTKDQLAKEKPQNCMSLDEEDVEEEADRTRPSCSCCQEASSACTTSGLSTGASSLTNFKCPPTPIQVSNLALERHRTEERLRRESFEKIATPTHQARRRPLLDNRFDFNSLEVFSKSYSNSRGALFSTASRDQSTDTIDELSPISPTNPAISGSSAMSRTSGHRASLPRNELISSLGTSGAGQTTLAANRSLPASPALDNNRKFGRKGLGKSLFYSPMMLRKVMKQKFNYLDCSSEDENTSDDERRSSNNSEFKDLESFQKANLKKKMKVKRRGSRVTPDSETSPKKNQVTHREFVLHNKAPFWNEVSQVYQLDFGGRVTQESAKNFQIEHQGKQVMQFGRIDGNAYTLDFQYPFSAIQALGVALANVTQRLK